MNPSPDDLDRELRAHFRERDSVLPHDPFVGMTARRIGAARRRRHYSRLALQGAALAALVLGSRWLIAGAALVSLKLDTWFDLAFDWFVTPLGTTILLAGILGTTVTVLRWRAHRSG